MENAGLELNRPKMWGGKCQNNEMQTLNSTVVITGVRSKLKCICVCAEAVAVRRGAQELHPSIGTRVKPLYTALNANFILYIPFHFRLPYVNPVAYAFHIRHVIHCYILTEDVS